MHLYSFGAAGSWQFAMYMADSGISNCGGVELSSTASLPKGASTTTLAHQLLHRLLMFGHAFAFHTFWSNFWNQETIGVKLRTGKWSSHEPLDPALRTPSVPP
jgi:hypothetical protein